MFRVNNKDKFFIAEIKWSFSGHSFRGNLSVFDAFLLLTFFIPFNDQITGLVFATHWKLWTKSPSGYKVVNETVRVKKDERGKD